MCPDTAERMEGMIGIIILNYITWADTERCVRSIWETESDRQFPYHIYIVDNASPDPAPQSIQEICGRDGITYIQSDKNIGYAAGNNLGIRRAVEDGCDNILISNSDVCFTGNCISRMAAYLQNHPKVGIVGPKILDAEGRLQKSCLCRRTGLKEKYLVRTRLNLFFRKQYRTYFGLDRDYDKTFRVYAVLGCCFMISPQCVREVFPFDEGTFLYEEEYIVGIRMEQAGYETHYVPECVIRHLHGSSTGEVKPFAYMCETASEIYYCRKYLGAAKWQIIPLYIYRLLKYDIKCLQSREFREYRREFREKVKLR